MKMSSRGGRIRAAGALLLGLLSCSRPLLEDAQLEQLAEVAAQVDGDRLMGMVADVVDARRRDTALDCSFIPESERPYYSEEVCHLTRQKTAEYMQKRFEELGLQVRHDESSAPPLSSSNIIVELPGVSRPEEIVLVGAHYDSFYEGADDNATGVAALLEIARVLSGHRFDRTVRFVGFDLEEFGLIGSSRYIAEQKGSERIVASMIFDCLGYYDSRPGSQSSLPGLPTPSTGDFIAAFGNDNSRRRVSELFALNEALKLTKVVSVIAPGNGAGPLTGNLMRSDHAAFWLTNHETVFLTDTANFRNPHYHQKTDTLDTLEPVAFRRTVQLSAATLAFWAGGPR